MYDSEPFVSSPAYRCVDESFCWPCTRRSLVYLLCITCCESEVITWILPVPLDYILVEMVDGFAVVSDTTCAPFDRTYAVWGS